MTNEIPKVDHLLLLVGGNPLPNAVVGRLLVNDSGKITLIHTNGTESIAERLKIWFTKQAMDRDAVTLRETDRTNRHEIYKTVETVVKKGEAGVGLHYTGGTAAMAVHAHAAVAQRANEPVFSYLDATTLCIKFDHGLSSYVGFHPDFHISIEDLFHLHGWEVNSYKEYEPNEKRRPKLDPGQYNGDGKAFERDVYQQLLQIKERFNLSPVWMSTFADRGHVTSEFDVLALRGYQLFYLSCTIIEPYKDYSASTVEYKKNKRDEIKQKLFEAFIRARQLGGDEACTALVCYVDDPTIEVEVQQTLEVEGRVRVFGRKHLPKLSQHFANWIKTQSREGQLCQ